ncbi:MAG: hypothetical protein CMH54_01040 [Myxococcales bacterium]|nr:hypothetical protein [Myxococcales bacterium]
MRLFLFVVISSVFIIADPVMAQDGAPKAAALERMSAQKHFQEGTDLLESKQGDLGVAHLSEAVRLKPDFREAWYNLGLAYSGRGGRDSGEKEIFAYRKAISIDPRYSKAYFNLGVCYEEKGDLEKAERAYRKAASLDERDFGARMNLGVVLADQNRLKEASKYYEEALEINDQVPDLHFNLGRVYTRVGDGVPGPEARKYYEMALDRYAQALKLKPNMYKAEYNSGLVLHMLGRTEEEIEAFKRALALRARYPQALYNLAYTFESVHRYEDALVYWERYVKIAEKVPTERAYVPAARRAILRLRAVVQGESIDEDEP